MRILMVCLGNICRSPLAEVILKSKTQHLKIIIDSAGTAGYHVGKKPDARSIYIANKNNINIKEQKARQFNRSDFDNFDIIYAMDKNNYSHLIALAKNEDERLKIRLILNEIIPGKYNSIPDPYYDHENGFQNVYNMLEKACEKITNQIG